MVDEFTWSFGGDKSAEQAVNEWAKGPHYLSELERVLGMPCRATDADHVECPGRGDLSFRAGFVRVQSAWKLAYFVAGD